MAREKKFKLVSFKLPFLCELFVLIWALCRIAEFHVENQSMDKE